MTLVERIETTHLGGPRKLRFLEYNGYLFVNRSVDIASAIMKIRKQSKEYSTKQSKDQLQQVQTSEVKYSLVDLHECFPEYFI